MTLILKDRVVYIWIFSSPAPTQSILTSTFEGKLNADMIFKYYNQEPDINLNEIPEFSLDIRFSASKLEAIPKN